MSSNNTGLNIGYERKKLFKSLPEHFRISKRGENYVLYKSYL